MKIGITGGDGQLGLALRHILNKENRPFVSWSSKDLNINNHTKINSVLSKKDIDVLVNCAAWTDVELAEKYPNETFETNAEAVKNLALVCKSNELKLIQISTDYVFSGLRSIPWIEEDLTKPVSVYGRSKELAEKYIQENYPENSLVIRTSWLYSRWRNNFAKKMVKKAIFEKEEISVIDDQRGQPTCCLDLGEKILEILDKCIKPGKYHLSNSGETNWYEYARKIFNLLGADSNRINRVKSIEYQAGVARPAYSVLDNHKSINMGVSSMRNWQDSLERELPNIIKSVKLTN